MAKATKTIRQALNYQPDHAAWFAANQDLFNRVVAFYFGVINAHEKLMDLSNKEALSALEKLTHKTTDNPDPIMPLSEVAEHIPAMFRRAAINAALGSARSFFTHLKKWKARKAKAEAKGKNCGDRPPVPPRTWKKSVPFYAGLWKDRTDTSIMLKVWTGSCWSWVKVRTLGKDLEQGFELGSPSLIRKRKQWWLHTPIEKKFSSPAKVAEQITTPSTRLCSVDLNLGDNLAVCTIQTVEGTTIATRFLKGGKQVNGFRKRQLGIIARNRNKTGTLAKGEQDNAALWQQIRHHDETLSHQISACIVHFAKAHGASILVFEHLGNLKPERGKYSKRGNSKRAFWMKGRIFQYTKYKAWNKGIITSRVNPRNTSRECARCHALVVRYAQGSPEEGYTVGAPLVVCPSCGMRGNADRNASIVIGQRLISRHQEKPPTLSARQKEDTKVSGATICQDAKGEKGPSISHSGRADRRGHGTAHGKKRRMEAPSPSIPTQLRLFSE
jgi:putative transposase